MSPSRVSAAVALIALLATTTLHAERPGAPPAPAAEIKHPVFPVEGGGGAEKLLAEYTDEQWLALVPRQSPRSGIPSPASGKMHWE